MGCASAPQTAAIGDGEKRVRRARLCGLAKCLSIRWQGEYGEASVDVGVASSSTTARGSCAGDTISIVGAGSVGTGEKAVAGGGAVIGEGTAVGGGESTAADAGAGAGAGADS